MNRRVFTTAAFLALFLTMAAGNSSAAPLSCADLLIGNTYSCTTVASGTGAGSSCLQFSAGPDVGSPFFASMAAIPLPSLVCSCNATGSLMNQNFGASKAFQCAAGDGAGGTASLSGTVSGNGKKISKGQGFFSGGSSFVPLMFKCEKVVSCP